MLEADNLSFGFSDGPVLDQLSLSVERGEVTAVIGPSGVGKTTLLRILALYLRPDAGRVSLDGTDPWALDGNERLSFRRRIGMVFQGATLFDTTVARNVEYGLKIRRDWPDRGRQWLDGLVGSRTTPEAVTDALSVVGLEESVDSPAASLSGGEAQRVSFARALAIEPELLLLDEPTSDLDPRNTAVIEDAVAEASERGIGVVIATHDMHQAERVSDRAAVLLSGEFTEVGRTEAVFNEPRDERTRQFISGELVYTEE